MAPSKQVLLVYMHLPLHLLVVILMMMESLMAAISISSYESFLCKKEINKNKIKELLDYECSPHALFLMTRNIAVINKRTCFISSKRCCCYFSCFDNRTFYIKFFNYDIVEASGIGHHKSYLVSFVYGNFIWNKIKIASS